MTDWTDPLVSWSSNSPDWFSFIISPKQMEGVPDEFPFVWNRKDLVQDLRTVDAGKENIQVLFSVVTLYDPFAEISNVHLREHMAHVIHEAARIKRVTGTCDFQTVMQAFEQCVNLFAVNSEDMQIGFLCEEEFQRFMQNIFLPEAQAFNGSVLPIFCLCPPIT